MPNLPSLRHLWHLTALHDHGHFGRAAEACHVTQSTLSASIKELEGVLETTLVDRSKRRVIFTPIGIETVERARRIVKEVEDLVSLTTGSRGPLSGTLRMGTIRLYSVLAEAGLPVICVETRHMRAMLKAQINKTDRNDARGIAQMMRVGLYRPVHVKTLRSQKLRMLLTHRKLLQSKAIAIENDLRGSLRNFGLKVGMVGTVKFEVRIKELVENLPDLAVLVEPLCPPSALMRQIGQS
jgi:Bacterial regulatory helix-turn-helix protein, lysR family/Transposase